MCYYKSTENGYARSLKYYLFHMKLDKDFCSYCAYNNCDYRTVDQVKVSNYKDLGLSLKCCIIIHFVMVIGRFCFQRFAFMTNNIFLEN